MLKDPDFVKQFLESKTVKEAAEQDIVEEEIKEEKDENGEEEVKVEMVDPLRVE